MGSRWPTFSINVIRLIAACSQMCSSGASCAHSRDDPSGAHLRESADSRAHSWGSQGAVGPTATLRPGEHQSQPGSLQRSSRQSITSQKILSVTVSAITIAFPSIYTNRLCIEIFAACFDVSLSPSPFPSPREHARAVCRARRSLF